MESRRQTCALGRCRFRLCCSGFTCLHLTMHAHTASLAVRGTLRHDRPYMAITKYTKFHHVWILPFTLWVYVIVCSLASFAGSMRSCISPWLLAKACHGGLQARPCYFLSRCTCTNIKLFYVTLPVLLDLTAYFVVKKEFSVLNFVTGQHTLKILEVPEEI